MSLPRVKWQVFLSAHANNNASPSTGVYLDLAPVVNLLLEDTVFHLLLPVQFLGEEPHFHKVSPQSTDPVPLYSVYSKLQNVNKGFLGSPETLCLHSAACCTHCREELDQ